MTQYVTVTEASKLLGETRGAIWKRIYRRKVYRIQVGNVALVRLEDVGPAKVNAQ